jgi:starch synthase
MNQPLKVLFLAAEAAPYIKVGGLADVAGSLPQALKALGHDIRLALPRHKSIDGTQFDFKLAANPFLVPVGADHKLTEVLETSTDGIPAYFAWDEYYFGRDKVYSYDDDAQRFVFFGRTILAFIKQVGWQPDVIHANDWHTAFVPTWLATAGKSDPFYAPIATAYTIHNVTYHGTTGNTILRFGGLEGHVKHLEVEPPGAVNWMARGIVHSDAINTVSKRYAQEIQTPEFGAGMEGLLKARNAEKRLCGIINGVDYAMFDPATDPHLTQHFDLASLDTRALNKAALQSQVELPVRDDVPLIGLISRLVDQKGFDILSVVLDRLFARDVQFVLLGTGDKNYEEAFGALTKRFPHKAMVLLKFDAALAQKIYGGSDMFLMPSRFEPCGLGQLIAMRYGSVPVVRATGGLADTVTEYDPAKGKGTGFVFSDYSGDALWGALERALDVFRDKRAWRGLQERGMKADWSWNASAKKYDELYWKAIGFHKGQV